MKEVHNKIDISDIEIQRCDDDKERHILNSPNKIIRWIKYKFEEQEIDHNRNKDSGLPPFRCIDLSNCIINTFSHEDNPSITNLCDILSENEKVDLLDCFINNGYGNQYYHEVLERFICKNSIIYAAFFHNTKFHEEVDFNGTIFKGHASFGGCLFKKDAFFHETKFSGNFGFDRCIFENMVYFSNAELAVQQINFSNSIFKNDFDARNLTITTRETSALRPYITFSGAQFHKEFDFSNNNIALNIIFSNAKFHGHSNFSMCDFRNSSNFDDTEITGTLLFTNYSEENEHSEIRRNTINEISFKRSNISGRIDFENCEISKLNMNFTTIKADGIFRIYESHLSYLDLTSLSNKGILILEDNQDYIEEISLKSAINSGTIEIENTEILKIKDRKTARLIKDSAFKNGNIIDSLKYKSKEMDLYEKELLNKNISALEKFKLIKTFLIWKTKIKIYLRPIIRFFDILWELILLKLNIWSNNNGLSWTRGIIFTCTVWVLFYGLFLMCREGIGSEFFLTNSAYKEEFIKYLWLPEGFIGLYRDNQKNPIVNDPIGWGAISFFILGKIFIGYGIYQTISAFRKHGK